jgi:sirohydrochlorin cobaltochelatase
MARAEGPVALVVAAHGAARSGNEPIERLVRRLARRRVAAEVAAAFHRGRPGFGSVLDRLRAGRVVVVPLFTSDGYYVRTVLPRELRRNARYGQVALATTPPIGCHPRVAALVSRRLRHRFGELLARPSAELVVVGHGTERSATSGRATLALAAQLRARGVARRVTAAFLDQEPLVDAIGAASRAGPLVVFPFLIGGGAHAAIDLPGRLRGSRGELVIDQPFGELAEIADLVADSCRRGARRIAA